MHSGVRSALAGLLVVLLLLVGVLASDASAHRAFHRDGNLPSGLCAACLLAKGQVQDADTAPIVVAFNRSLVWIVPLPERGVLPGFDYCAAPSRAPPLSAPPLSVAG